MRPITSARPDLDGQTLAALGAARGDDGAAAAGLHAHQETMGAGATGLGSLQAWDTLAWRRTRDRGRCRPYFFSTDHHTHYHTAPAAHAPPGTRAPQPPAPGKPAITPKIGSPVNEQKSVDNQRFGGLEPVQSGRSRTSFPQ
ncbi:unnamed protein product [Victoria cruziana]